MNIVVHVERLVLDGLPVTSAQGPRLRRAVERELRRLLTAQGLAGSLAGGGALPRIEAPPLRFKPQDRPDSLGRGIANTVYGGIGKP